MTHSSKYLFFGKTKSVDTSMVMNQLKREEAQTSNIRNGKEVKLQMWQRHEEECDNLTIDSMPVKLKTNEMGKKLQPSYQIWNKKI